MLARLSCFCYLLPANPVSSALCALSAAVACADAKRLMAALLWMAGLFGEDVALSVCYVIHREFFCAVSFGTTDVTALNTSGYPLVYRVYCLTEKCQACRDACLKLSAPTSQCIRPSQVVA